MLELKSMDHLYKYLTWNDRAKDVSKTERIWYSRLSKFNDPFEGLIEIESDISAEAIISLAIKTFSHEGTWQRICNYVKSKVLRDDYGGLQIKSEFWEKLDAAAKKTEEDFSKIGVLSLSESPVDILLWSHYADSHRGICIEFERSEGEISFDHNRCRPVVYKNKYPKPSLADIIQDPGLLTNKAVFTKSEHWSYEKEWRIWKEKGDALHEMPGKITSVILGCNWSGNMKEVQLLASKHDAQILKAKIVEGSYSLELHEVEFKQGSQTDVF